MLRNRLLGFVALVGLGAALVGCTKQSSTPPAPVDTPGPPAQPGDLHQMDPAKHVVPAATATGKLAGKTFTPDRVVIRGNGIEFRVGKDTFSADSTGEFDAGIIMNIGAGDQMLADGKKLTVRPDDRRGAKVPALNVYVRQGKGLPKPEYVFDGYAMTLEIEKAENGKCKGKVYLCLPGDDKSYLAGTFVAERK